MTIPSQQVTLKEVASALKKRLNATPVKEYWREHKSTVTGMVDITGVELNFVGLKPETVKSAMKGINQIERKRFNDRAYTWLLRWEHQSAKIKFRCTLYVYADGNQNFIFTTVW